MEDYEGREETVTGDQTEWDLLKMDESLGSIPVIGVGDRGESIVGPPSVDGGEGEGECSEGGRADGEGDCGVLW